ncbi:MAG: hypothetical protein IJK12_04890 [Clostridia bacterium]|nr:hypothetical protein [Clostridia bacterium]
MKRKSILKRSLSLFLSFCMVFGLAVMMPAAALADEGDSDGRAPTDHNEYKSVAIIDSRDCPENPDDPPLKWHYTESTSCPNGMLIQTQNGYKGSFELYPSVTAKDYALHVTSDVEGSVSTVQVDGLVTSGKDALSVTATNQGSVIVTAEAVESTETGDGVDIEASGGAKADVKTGAITAKGTGITVSAESGATVEVNAGGAVNAGQDGVYILADGDGTEVAVFAMDEVNAKNEGVDIEASDGATAGGIVGKVTSSEKNAFGVWIKAKDTSAGSSAVSIPDISSISVDPEAEDGKWHTVPTASITDSSSAATVSLVTGDVTAYAGIHVEADGAVAGIKTDKVTATNGNTHDQDGVLDRLANEFIATNKGLVTGTLGDVESGEDGCGISVYVYEGGVATVNAENIQAGEIGVHIDNEGGTTWTDVGSITSGCEGIGITLVGDDAVSIAFADGNVTSDGDNGISISNDGGHTMVCVSGDASSTATDRAGLRFYGSGETLVLVVGTLSGANGVQLENGWDGLDLTTWQVKPTAKNGEYFAGDDKDGTFAKTVSYIVLVEQPVAGGTLTAVQADGSELNKKYDDQGSGGFEVASETQKIYLKVKADKGYKLVGAYNGMENRKALMKDENGYYLEVPIGGGIYLTAVLKLDEHGNVVVQNAGRTRKALISLDPAGGTMTGKTEFSKAIGSTFMFTEEPVWEGHQFLYWESTAHPGLQYKTGDRFIVEESDTFVAVWA